MWFKRRGIRFFSISNSFYNNPNIFERIKSFQSTDFTKSSYPPQEIISPPFLREANAKYILQHVRTHKIPNNIRIIHALTHIQYNAFMSYLDTLIRFRSDANQYEQQFIKDMKEVALQQGLHFTLLSKRLEELNFQYGQLPVIPKLSHAIKQTSNNIIERIGVIALLHEGRGVKAVLSLLGQLSKQGDKKSVQIVQMIQKDEEKHFSIGWKWFYIFCQMRKLATKDQISILNNKFKGNIILPVINPLVYH